nr:MAG TPA_asm: hypothetical protein [Caudoviricetes sp.]
MKFSIQFKSTLLMAGVLKKLLMIGTGGSRTSEP